MAGRVRLPDRQQPSAAPCHRSGFAVVAHEVEELAKGTAQATTEVTSRITAIQEQVDRVVDVLGRIGKAVDSINETQAVIGGVLTEQTAVTRAIVG